MNSIRRHLGCFILLSITQHYVDGFPFLRPPFEYFGGDSMSTMGLGYGYGYGRNGFPSYGALMGDHRVGGSFGFYGGGGRRFRFDEYDFSPYRSSPMGGFEGDRGYGDFGRIDGRDYWYRRGRGRRDDDDEIGGERGRRDDDNGGGRGERGGGHIRGSDERGDGQIRWEYWHDGERGIRDDDNGSGRGIRDDNNGSGRGRRDDDNGSGRGIRDDVNDIGRGRRDDDNGSGRGIRDDVNDIGRGRRDDDNGSGRGRGDDGHIIGSSEWDDGHRRRRDYWRDGGSGEGRDYRSEDFLRYVMVPNDSYIIGMFQNGATSSRSTTDPYNPFMGRFYRFDSFPYSESQRMFNPRMSGILRRSRYIRRPDQYSLSGEARPIFLTDSVRVNRRVFRVQTTDPPSQDKNKAFYDRNQPMTPAISNEPAIVVNNIAKGVGTTPSTLPPQPQPTPPPPPPTLPPTPPPLPTLPPTLPPSPEPLADPEPPTDMTNDLSASADSEIFFPDTRET